MGKVKIAFIGTGFMGQKAHLEHYKCLGDVEIAAIAEARTDIAEKVCKKFDIPQYFTDYKDLLNNVEVDGYACIQQYRNHLAILPDVLAKGKPVITEKPLSFSPAAGEKLVKAAADSGAVHMVGYHKRSDPAMEYAKSIIDSWKETGEFGKMKYVRATMPPGNWINNGAAGVIGSKMSYPPLDSEPVALEGFTEKEALSYNMFVNYYIHQVNAMRFLLGEPYHVTFADKAGVIMACESDSGIPAILEMAPFNNSIEWNESYLVSFGKGYVFIELPAPLAAQRAGKVTIMKDNDNEKKYEIPIMPNVAAMRNQAMNFVKVVKGERQAPCESSEALLDLYVALDYIRMKSKNA